MNNFSLTKPLTNDIIIFYDITYGYYTVGGKCSARTISLCRNVQVRNKVVLHLSNMTNDYIPSNQSVKVYKKIFTGSAFVWLLCYMLHYTQRCT